MMSFSSAFFALTAFISVAQATPKVTPVLDDQGCAAYPQYEPATGFIAHFTLQVNQCTDPATSKPCPVEDHGSGYESLFVDGEEDVTQGSITILTNKNGAQIRFQCSDESGVEAQTADESNFGYSNIAVANRPKSAELMWGLSEDETIPIEPYHHVVDGEEQEGSFWGSQNVTTWAIKKYENHAGEPYWGFRLLLSGGEDLKEGEYETFLRIGDYWGQVWP